MEFIEASAFTRLVSSYLSDEEYASLQAEMARHPDGGDLMPGTGGFRKLRWADARRSKGRRGGLRIIYYYFSDERQIWLMTLYGKNEVIDLTPSQKGALKDAIAEERKLRAEKRNRRRGR